MTASIRIGFNMHPRWADGDQLLGFLEPLRKVGLSTLEFELDQHLRDWVAFPSLMEACFELGFELCFHAPYREPNSIAGFTSTDNSMILDNYQPMLAIAQGWADRSARHVNVVVHGAKSSLRERASLREDTLQFLKWGLAEYQGLNFAFEVAGPTEKDEIKVGADRIDVWEILKSLDHPRLGICWDMGHDHLNGSSIIPDEQWMKKVIHVHVHDVDEDGVDHFPMVFGKVPYRDWLPALRRSGMNGIVTLEIKGGLLRSWSLEKINKALIESIMLIRSLTA